MTMKVLFILAGDRNKASSRVRGYWVAEEMVRLGHHCSLITDNSRWSLLKLFLSALSFDVVIFQKTYGRYHLLLLIWLRIFGKRVFLDIDDAPSRVNKASTLRNFQIMVSFSTKVFCGSNTLLGYVDSIRKNKAILIPTSVKLENYNPQDSNNNKVCIGWVGNGKHYSEDLVGLLIEPLKRLSAMYDLRLKIIGACGVKNLYEEFGQIENLELDFIDNIIWSEDQAVGFSLLDIDIGVYPLIDNDFNSFKCGFKALEYAAMKIPVVSSPSHSNLDVIKLDKTGFIACSTEEWVQALEELIVDKEKRIKIGNQAYDNVIANFSITSTTRKLLEIIAQD